MIVQDCLASYVCGISWAFHRVNTNQLGMQEIIFLSKMSILANDNLFWIRYGIIDNYTDKIVPFCVVVNTRNALVS